MTTKADNMSAADIIRHQSEHWNPSQYPDDGWGKSMRGVCEFMQGLSVSEYRSWLRSSQDYGKPDLTCLG